LQQVEKLFRLLAGLVVARFYGSVTIRLAAGKIGYVEADAAKRLRSGTRFIAVVQESNAGPGSRPLTIF